MEYQAGILEKVVGARLEEGRLVRKHGWFCGTWGLLFWVAVAGFSGGCAGGSHLQRARQAFQAGDYQRAIAYAGKESAPGREAVASRLLLADIYHEMDSARAEVACLEAAAALDTGLSLLFYRLAAACYRTGDYDKGLAYLLRFDPGGSGTLALRARRLEENLRFCIRAVQNPLPFSPVSLGSRVNSAYDEYWPSFTVDENMLVFTRLLPAAEPGLRKQEDFYFSVKDSLGWGTALPLSELNTPGNEGAQTLSADGKLFFYTLCNHPGGFGSCDIWYSRLVQGKWTTPANAGPLLNTPGWEGQPSLSAAGDLLFFSSDRPGGKGKKDIWFAELEGWTPAGHPVWGAVANAGDSINSYGDEISPFLHPGMRDLYFSSDSRPGFGGLDLFHARQKPDGQWSQPRNLGYPVNTPGNEQGLVIDRTGGYGYFATGGIRDGNMDLYRFETGESFRPAPVTYVKGRVSNATTGDPVSALVAVTGSDPAGRTDIRIRADENGFFLTPLPTGRDLMFSVKEKGFLFYSERFRLNTGSYAEPLERTIQLFPAEPGKTVNLYNIFFSTGEYAILPESEPELGMVLRFLAENPELPVEIGGHTDNVGTPEFNLSLSERRALSVRQYLLDKGIAPERLAARGYGMDQPVASNDSEEGRAKNRRTTLLITGLPAQSPGEVQP